MSDEYRTAPMMDAKIAKEFDAIKEWVIRNNNIEEAMDWLNKTTYPFTSAYRMRDRANRY